ncbi:MAG: translation initiation factor IF-2, partial [bacterium]
IVAINKIDKPEANIDKVKQELSSQLNIIPEDWGGKIVCSPISAKNGEGIDELLDVLLLTADLEEDNLRANANALAIGTVIESNVDKNIGIVATVLVQNGTLHVGDNLIYKNVIYGKVRSLKNHKGETVDSAGPSTPVKVIGFKIAPEVGDIIEVGEGEKIKIRKMKSGGIQNHHTQQSSEEKDNGEETINLMIKSDTLGSGEAIESSFSKIDTHGVKINIINKGLGNITEGDILKAEANHAQLIGFSVNISPQAQELARENKVNVKIYKIIYELINDIKEQIQELVKPEIKRVDLGRMKVLAIFRTEKHAQIIGGKVLEGQIKSNSFVEIKRDGEIIEEGKIGVIKIGKEEVGQAETNAECGLSYEGRPVIKEGDILNVYQEEKIYKKVN